MKKYMKNEREILSRVEHENIVKYYSFEGTARNYYLVFEYCAGKDLYSYVKANGPLGELLAQRFFR